MFIFARADNASSSKSVKLFPFDLDFLLSTLKLLKLLVLLFDEEEELELVDELDLILVPTTLSLSPGGNPGIDNELLETISADDVVVDTAGAGGVKLSESAGEPCSLVSSVFDTLVTFFRTFLRFVLVFPLLVEEKEFEFNALCSTDFGLTFGLVTSLLLEVTLRRVPSLVGACVVGIISVTIAFPMNLDCVVDSVPRVF